MKVNARNEVPLSSVKTIITLFIDNKKSVKVQNG